MVGKTSSRKADQSAKPNATVNGYCMSMAILAGPMKYNWPSVTLWSVSNIQSHMTYICVYMCTLSVLAYQCMHVTSSDIYTQRCTNIVLS